MANNKKNNPLAGLIIGPLFIAFSVAGLWKNEHRFDYHKAASKTNPVEQVQELQTNQVFSHTGGMDQSLTMTGHYVESFSGYLTVNRHAEIYAWHEDRDDDGTDWSKKWMSSVESNSRNSGVKQQLKSHRYIPGTFQTGDLEINTGQIEFVDPHTLLEPASLILSQNGRAENLDVQSDYFYLSKGGTNRLGDERLSYRGIQVPTVATYFGKYGGQQAVALQAVQKEGFINSIIQDRGILHHLVKGERKAALVTMKGHIKRLKMIVRLIGTILNCVGWLVLFSVFTRFLYHIPLLGPVLQYGVGWVGLILGLVVSTVTIGSAYITSHPLILVMLLLAAAGVVFLMRNKAQQSQQQLRTNLEREVGHSLSAEQIKEMEFAELVCLSAADGQTDMDELNYLQDWGKRQGWDDSKIQNLAIRAQENYDKEGKTGTSQNHLLQLIRLALADGNLDEREMKTIRKVAKETGNGGIKLTRLINDARQMGAAA